MLQIPEMSMRHRFIPTWLWQLWLFIWRIISETQYDLLELWLGIGTTGWGLSLLNPYADTFASSPTFREMADFMPENHWGVAIFVAGAIQLAGVYLRHNPLRRAAALFLVWVWFFIAAMFIRANPASTASWVYFAMFAVPETLVYWRLKREQGERQRDERY